MMQMEMSFVDWNQQDLIFHDLTKLISTSIFINGHLHIGLLMPSKMLFLR